MINYSEPLRIVRHLLIYGVQAFLLTPGTQRRRRIHIPPEPPTTLHVSERIKHWGKPCAWLQVHGWVWQLMLGHLDGGDGHRHGRPGRAARGVRCGDQGKRAVILEVHWVRGARAGPKRGDSVSDINDIVHNVRLTSG